MRIATAIRSLILGAAISAIPAASFAGVFVSVSFGAPPVLPVYAQPYCPAPGYIWTPGYWAYDEGAGYYWVPGAWVLAPYEGALWTPGYWGWGNGGYLWNAGYWGPHVGFYGGVNYGFGYYGHGFEGGYWDRGRFRYNTAVMRVEGARFHDNVYNRRVVIRNDNRVSFNGGHGGLNARPSRDEQNWGREQHTAPLGAQHQNEMRASQNRQQFASVNHGRPENLARTEPASYNRNVPMNNHTAPTNNRPTNNGLMNSNPHNAPITNANRPAPFNNGQRPAANNQSFNRPQDNYNASRPPTQTYRPQPNMQTNQHTQPQQMRAPAAQSYRPQSNTQMNQHTQPQQMRAPAPQQSHSEPSHGNNGGGHEGGGGHGGHGR